MGGTEIVVFVGQMRPPSNEVNAQVMQRSQGYLPGEEYLFKTIVPTFKSGCKSLIAWAYVTYN